MEATNKATITKWQFIIQRFKGWRRALVLALIGLPVSFVTAYSTFDEQFRLPLLIDALPYNIWGLIVIGWISISLIVVIILLAESSNKYTQNLVIEKENENKQLRILNESNQIELLKIRQELRKQDESKVINIPDTLLKIANWYKQTANEKKKQKIEVGVCLKVITEFFSIKNIKEIVDVKALSRESVNVMDKRIRKRMGMNKPNAKLDIEWARRIYIVMDNNGVGLMRSENSEYLELEKQLKMQSFYISETKLYNIIWEYVDNAYAAFSMKVFTNIGNVKNAINYFPLQVRNTLEQMDTKLDRASGGGIAQINHILEKYKSGESLGEN